MRFLKGLFSKLPIAKDFLRFLMARKKWWLIPMVILLFLFALMIILVEISPAVSFIYVLF